EVKEADTKKYSKFFWQLLENGIYLVPSQFETNFVSVAHTEKDLQEASEKICQSLDSVFDGNAQ
ncbi:aspartate aminotransferase family protein, partial [bacterium]|nr:aspartate aminotransferase family protein [bacterium]